MNQLDQKLTVLFQDSTFKDEVKDLQSVEELQKILSSHGVDMTIDQVTELCVEIGKRVATEGTDAELDEEDLQDVSGGFGVITWTCIALGVVCLGAFGLGVYNGYKGKAKGNG